MRRTVILIATAALAHAGAAAAHEEAAATAFVPMKELTVPIVDGSRAYGRLRIKLVLEAHDAAALPALQAAMPQLRETALIAAAEFARLHASPFLPVDASRLAHDMSAALAAHDEHHLVAQVLVVEIFAARS